MRIYTSGIIYWVIIYMCVRIRVSVCVWGCVCVRVGVCMRACVRAWTGENITQCIHDRRVLEVWIMAGVHNRRSNNNIRVIASLLWATTLCVPPGFRTGRRYHQPRCTPVRWRYAREYEIITMHARTRFMYTRVQGVHENSTGSNTVSV